MSLTRPRANSTLTKPLSPPGFLFSLVVKNVRKRPPKPVIKASSSGARLGLFRSQSALISVACGLSLLSFAFLAGCDKKPPTENGAKCGPGDHNHAEARLLTRSEYRRTVQDLLKTETDPTMSFPPEPVVGGFENDASSHQANPLLVEKHALAAELLAGEVLGRGVETLFECDPEAGEQECALDYIEYFGRRAFRRPLNQAELDSFKLLYDRAAPSLGHEGALATFIEAALQSPQFLYRVEAPVGEGETEEEVVPLGPYELASRLSYFLWGTMPDEELLLAAENGELETASQVGAQARRLLQSDRAKERTREFHEQWLGLGRLSSIARNDSPPGAATAWEESTQLFLEHVFWGDSPKVSALFSDSTLFYNDVLGPLYDLPAGEAFASTQVPDTRSGLLTQPGLMALLAHSDQSSPIQRGVFVRENILCEEVEPPPPTVDNNPPDPDPNLTTRERFAVHTESPACARCHELIDPLGFGLEAYDHLGRYRDEENGLPIDTSGALVDLHEDALEGPFDGAQELSSKIATSESVLSCLAQKWFTFAMGRSQIEGDTCSLDAAVKVASQADGDLHELLLALCQSDAFRFRTAHESDEGAE